MSYLAMQQLTGHALQLAWHILNKHLPMEILREFGPADWKISKEQRSAIHMIFFLQAMQQIWLCATGGRQVADMPLMLSSSYSGDMPSLLTERRMMVLNAGVHKVMPPVLK